MRIGIIGGGQLGMMMAESAKKMHHQVVSLDPNPNCSITHFSDMHIAKPYNDLEAIKYLSKNSDVITYEFENVDLLALESYKSKLPQGLEALRISRNRLLEKNFAVKLEIPTPIFKEVKSKNDIFLPSILKTITGGYDGKGQIKLDTDNDIDQIDISDEIIYICESYINFDYEISVIATRGVKGEIIHFPVPHNIHKNGILHCSDVDNSINKEVLKKAIFYTDKIISELNYVGTLAVEFFVKGSKVIFNEFAPRPHNSGHYTIDGCNISQFDTHITAVTGGRLSNPKLLSNTMMINVLGQNEAYLHLEVERDIIHIKDYLKHSNKKNRKIGHINILYKNPAQKKKIYYDITKEHLND
jgi:5-(carboxyamino)imidazole ribonucleotide synthase